MCYINKLDLIRKPVYVAGFNNSYPENTVEISMLFPQSTVKNLHGRRLDIIPGKHSGLVRQSVTK